MAVPIGATFTSNSGHRAKVTAYKDVYHVTVVFEKPYTYSTTTSVSNLRRGMFRNKNAPSIYDWGIVGETGRSEVEYKVWTRMLQRVLHTRFHEKHPTYKDVDIHKDWQYLDNFKDWFRRQIRLSNYELDKDWLIPGNRVYGPDTCIFVPPELNRFLETSTATRGNNPTGVSYFQGRYWAKLSKENRTVNLGLFDTEKEARDVYVLAKEKYARQLATLWRGRIDQRLYAAVKAYRVSAYQLP